MAYNTRNVIMPLIPQTLSGVGYSKEEACFRAMEIKNQVLILTTHLLSQCKDLNENEVDDVYAARDDHEDGILEEK